MEDMEQCSMFDFPLVQEVQFLQHPANIYAPLPVYMKKEQEQLLKLLSKIKVKKNHTFLVVYECEYCDGSAGSAARENDWEGALEGLKGELVEQSDVFGKS